MRIKITRGTRIDVLGKVQKGQELTAPEDLTEGAAKFLVAIGHATVVADEPVPDLVSDPPENPVPKGKGKGK